jgi:hypothetical protein
MGSTTPPGVVKIPKPRRLPPRLASLAFQRERNILAGEFIRRSSARGSKPPRRNIISSRAKILQDNQTNCVYNNSNEFSVNRATILQG